ncbi:MAG: hypothetical protein HY287_11625 [Planctomycetes bacterium]|nr:hypothetical protein [Planctomycetota bacterium]
MNKGSNLSIRAGTFSLLFSLALITGCTNAPVIPGNGDLIFRDDFTSTAQDAGWSFLGTDTTKKSLTAKPGSLQLLPQSDGVDCDHTAQSYLLRQATGDFVLLTKMTFNPAVDLSLAGIVVQDDQGNAAALGVLSAKGAAGSFTGVILRVDQCPNPSPDRVAKSYAFHDVFLRLERSGNTFTGLFSQDGVAYTSVGTLTKQMSDTVQVGIGIVDSTECSSNCDAVQPADFDFFEIDKPATGQ